MVMMLKFLAQAIWCGGTSPEVIMTKWPSSLKPQLEFIPILKKQNLLTYQNMNYEGSDVANRIKNAVKHTLTIGSLK